MDDDIRSVLARRHRLALGLACVGLAFIVVALIIVLDAVGWGYDFEAYFLSALRIARGDRLYQSFMLDAPFSPGFYGYYMYAPPLAVALLPLTSISLPAATFVWLALRVALLALACGVMPVRTTVKLLVFAVAAFSQPVLVDLSLGNVSILVVVALAFVWRGLDRPMGSIAAAFAISVRPTLAVLLVWWGVRQHWRAVAWTLIAGAALILVTLPFVGMNAWADFLTMLRNISQVTGVSNNMDLATTVLRLNLDPIVATAALYAGYAVAVGAMILSLRHDRDLSFMVTISGTLLLAPLLWDHYLASLLLPAAFLAQRGKTWGLALPLLGWLPAPLLPLVAVAGTILPFLAERSDGSAPAAIDRTQGLWRRWAARGEPGRAPEGALGPVQPAFVVSGGGSMTVPVTVTADQAGTVAASGSAGSSTTSSPS